ncbi:elongation factor G [Suttonella sp. R2A3]|nr:elongation factor G [Suttonella sp. R2A3]UJF23871.1 elongation factor G [Suttonella sp. R2A3]
MANASLAAMAVDNIRTLALVGASGVGKTTLAEALLTQAGAIASAGSVARGSTVSDFDAQEIAQQHSLHTALLHYHYQDARVHLLDTPGMLDFIGHSMAALEAVETAAIVVNAAIGVDPLAQRMMRYAADRQMDRMVIVNKMDSHEADLPALLAEIQEVFGRECLPVNLPVDGARDVVDCFFNRKGQSDFGDVSAAHNALVEQVVDVDEAFLERYLEDGDIPATELHAPLEQALAEGHLIPVCFVSAETGAGVDALLEVIDKLLPSPCESNPATFLQGEEEDAVPLLADPDPAAHVLAHVFNIRIDPYVGKIAAVRVHQGTIRPGSQLYIGDARKPFKVAHLYVQQGKQQINLEAAVPGDICSLVKVEDLAFDAVLHDAPEDVHIRLKPLNFPMPMHGLALTPQQQSDEQRLWEVLNKMVAEDPCLRLTHIASTNETVLYGLGDLHLRSLLERLRSQHQFEVDTAPPQIEYRETITQAAEGQYRHKKQSGGAGQFGEVHLRIEPLARGEGFEFIDAVKGGVIPGQFIPAVEKGIREVLSEGAIAGYPVVDVRVTVYDGKHHSVDSKEVAFVSAGKKGLSARDSCGRTSSSRADCAPEHSLLGRGDWSYYR